MIIIGETKDFRPVKDFPLVRSDALSLKLFGKHKFPELPRLRSSYPKHDYNPCIVDGLFSCVVS